MPAHLLDGVLPLVSSLVTFVFAYFVLRRWLQLTLFFNIYGVLMLGGDAAYSAWLFWRKRVLLNRVVGNLFIAVGALAPGFGGAFQRAGLPYALYIGEFLGAVLMFIGFMYATKKQSVEKRE